jgi:hypothetical protein
MWFPDMQDKFFGLQDNEGFPSFIANRGESPLLFTFVPIKFVYQLPLKNHFPMSKKYLRIFPFFLYLLLSLQGYGQEIAPAINWQKTIGGSEADVLFAVVQTPDNGYIVGGYSVSNISGEKTSNNKGGNDYWIVKLDSAGSIEWQKTIGGNGEDILSDISLCENGGYIISGTSTTGIDGDKTDTSRDDPGFSSFFGGDLWLLRLNSTGDILWQKTYGGLFADGKDHAILNGDSVISLFRNSQVIQTNDGGFIVGLSAASGISGDKTDSNRSEANAMLSFLSFLLTDYWVIKLDNNGNIQWQKTFGTEDNDKFSSLLQTADGGYMVGGTAESTYLTAVGSTVSGGDKTDTIRGKGDYWILKLNGSGAIVWQKTLGGSEEEQLICMDQTADGGYILGGYSGSGISGEKTDTSRGGYDYWIVKLNATGTIDWQRTIGGNGQDVLTSIKELPDGNYLVGGASSSGISGEKTENGYGGTSDFWTMKLDATGNIIWQKILGGTSSDVSHIEMPASIRQTQDGGFITAGLSDGALSGNKSDSCRGHYDYWVLKLLRCEADTTFASASLCGQALYELPDGVTVQFPGVYYSLVPGFQGCDSVVVTNIMSTDIDVNVVVNTNTLTADVIAGATYQWIFCSNSQPVPGATSNIYQPVDGAYYAVTVNLNGCKDTSMCYHVTPTGIDPLVPKESILIYPNPATNMVFVQNDDTDQAISQVSLIEMATGKIVLSKDFTSSAYRKYNLNISEMPAGSYLLRIQTTNGNMIKHLQILK